MPVYNIELTAHITVEIGKYEGEEDAVQKARDLIARYPLKYLNVTYIEKG